LKRSHTRIDYYISCLPLSLSLSLSLSWREEERLNEFPKSRLAGHRDRERKERYGVPRSGSERRREMRRRAGWERRVRDVNAKKKSLEAAVVSVSPCFSPG